MYFFNLTELLTLPYPINSKTLKIMIHFKFVKGYKGNLKVNSRIHFSLRLLAHFDRYSKENPNLIYNAILNILLQVFVENINHHTTNIPITIIEKLLPKQHEFIAFSGIYGGNISLIGIMPEELKELHPYSGQSRWDNPNRILVDLMTRKSDILQASPPLKLAKIDLKKLFDKGQAKIIADHVMNYYRHSMN